MQYYVDKDRKVQAIHEDNVRVPPDAYPVWTRVQTDGFYEIGEVLPEIHTKTVRTFSKFSIWVATQNIPLTLPDGTASTVWTEFENFMKNAVLPGGNTLYSGWMNLNDLTEDNEFFEQFYPLAVEQFGKELVDNVLAASVTSTKTVIVEPEQTE